MKTKKLITGIAMVCVSTLFISCASNQKTGCYYGETSAKEIPAKKNVATKSYTIAE